VRAGRVTPGQLRSSAWTRLFPDVYACRTVRLDHGVRARAAAQFLLPEGVVCGRSAAVLWGVDLTDPGDDVECTVPATCRRGAVQGIRQNRRALGPGEVTTRSGVRVTTPLRTALDLARLEPRAEAVAWLDQFVRARLVTLDELRTAAAHLTGRDCRRVRAVVALVDGLAMSPQETRLRLLVLDSDLPRPVAQYEVHDAAGRFVAKVDLGWPEARVAVEYDGAWHGAAQQVGPDRRRLNALTAAGWTVVFVTAGEMYRPDEVIGRIAGALATSRHGRR
jgi:hypothetical protein